MGEWGVLLTVLVLQEGDTLVMGPPVKPLLGVHILPQIAEELVILRQDNFFVEMTWLATLVVRATQIVNPWEIVKVSVYVLLQVGALFLGVTP